MADGERPTDWTEAERRAPPMAAELTRLLRRGRARPWLTLGAAVVITGLVVVAVARRPPSYRARLVLRVSEGSLERTEMPMPSRDLEAFVREVAFARPQLLPIIEQRGLYPDLVAVDPNLAVAEMRKDITVSVARNYFLEYRRRGEGPRSVRVLIYYRGASREAAGLVVRDLGELARLTLAGGRREVDTEAAALAQLASETTRARLLDLEHQLAAARVALAGGTGDPARLQVDIARLDSAIAASTAELVELEDRELELTLDRDSRGGFAGLNFEVAQVQEPPERGPAAVRLAVTGGIAFVLLLPLCAVAVGAFDRRVYEVDDVRRLGLEPIGSIRLG